MLPAILAMAFFVLLSLESLSHSGGSRVDKVKQVGAFHKWDNALALSEEIQKSGKRAFIMEKTHQGRIFYAVLESQQNSDLLSPPPTVQDMGYVQVGSFLKRGNAEQMIISLRRQGVITFHCMKKLQEKVYYKVYKKTGPVASSPCTLETSEMSKPSAMLSPNASLTPPPRGAISADTSAVTGEPPVTRTNKEPGLAPEGEHTSSGMAEAGDIDGSGAAEPRFIVNTTDIPDIEDTEDTASPEAQPQSSIVNTTDEQVMAGDTAMHEPGEQRFIVNSTGNEMTSPASEEDAATKKADPDMVATNMVSPEDVAEVDQGHSTDVSQALPLTGPLTGRPPLTQAPPDVVLDTSPIRPVDDNRHFYIKPEAVVFANRDQFGTWYARFNELGGGMVTGHSNKWYTVWFREGVTGYVQKADTVEYELPYENEETYR